MQAHSISPSQPKRPLALSRLAIGALLALGGATGAQAQSLVELYEAARDFDATYQIGRAHV